MTDEILDPRFERDLRAVLAESEPADVPPTLYASVASVTRPVVSTLPRRRGWDRRALAMLAAAAVLAIVAVGFGSGLVRLPGILPLIGGPTAVPTTQTYRLYYEVTPLDRHEPTTDELQRALEVLRARVAADQGTATGEVLADIPNTVAVDVVVPGDEPGRLAEVRTLLSMTGQLVAGGTVNQGVQLSMSVDELGFEPLFGPGTGIIATERPYKGQTAIDLQLSTDVAAQVEAWRKANQNGILAFAVDEIVWYFHPLGSTITNGRISMLFPPDEIAAGIPQRLLALFSSGSHPNPVREVAPRGVELAPGITPEPSPDEGADAALVAAARAYAEAAGFALAPGAAPTVEDSRPSMDSVLLRLVALPLADRGDAQDTLLSVYFDDSGRVLVVEDGAGNSSRPTGAAVDRDGALETAARHFRTAGVDPSAGTLTVVKGEPGLFWYITLDRAIDGYPVANTPAMWRLSGDKAYVSLRGDGTLADLYAIRPPSGPAPQVLATDVLDERLATVSGLAASELADLDPILTWVRARDPEEGVHAPVLSLGYCVTKARPDQWSGWCVDAGTGEQSLVDGGID